MPPSKAYLGRPPRAAMRRIDRQAHRHDRPAWERPGARPGRPRNHLTCLPSSSSARPISAARPWPRPSSRPSWPSGAPRRRGPSTVASAGVNADRAAAPSMRARRRCSAAGYEVAQMALALSDIEADFPLRPRARDGGRPPRRPAPQGRCRACRHRAAGCPTSPRPQGRRSADPTSAPPPALTP